MIPYKTILVVAGLAVAAKSATVIAGGEPGKELEGAVISAPLSPTTGEPQGAEGAEDELPEILTAIAAEHEAIARKRESLEEQEARIALAADALSVQIAQLEALRTEITGLVEQTETEQTADVERLVNIYRAMKPAQAGAIMNEMDIEVAVLVLAAMDEKTSGPIIATMNPIRARAVSKIIFERSRLPGDQKLINVRLD